MYNRRKPFSFPTLFRRRYQYRMYQWRRHPVTLVRGLVVLLAAVCIVLALVRLVGSHENPKPPVNGGRTDGGVSSPLSSPSSQQVFDAGAKAYGIAAGSSLTALDSKALDKRLHAMSDLGVTWVRYDFDWSLIQPQDSGHYSWQKYDELVSLSSKYHMHVLGILDFTPAWARVSDCDNSHCAPSSTDAFARFASETVKRYGPRGVSAWEVWNEPNSKDFWQPKADVARYTALLKSTSSAIRAADTKAYVLTGGLSPQATDGESYTPTDFLRGVYHGGGQAYFDGVADHPYTFPLSPASDEDHAWNQMAKNSDGLRAIMVGNGDGAKKIWITEFGAPTGGPGPESTLADPNLDAQPYRVDEALQAKILSDAVKLYSGYDWAGPFFVYSYQDAGATNDTNENFFGLTRYDGSHKPAYDVYRSAIDSLK
jgi:hypothetical protein